MKQVAEIVIEDYPRRVATSKAQRAVYYVLDDDGIIRSSKGKILPKKYLLPEYKTVAKYANPSMLKYPYDMYVMGAKEKLVGTYSFSLKTINWFNEPIKKYKIVLVDTTLPQIMYANPRAAGNPRWVLIKGNDIYAGTIHPYTRAAVARYLHEVFEEAIAKQCPRIEEYPIVITCELFDEYDDEFAKGKDWDIDNRVFMYNKTFIDSLTATGKIVDDNRTYIVGSPGCRFVPITPNEKPRLVYKIFKVDYSQYPEYDREFTPIKFNPNDADRLY